MKKITLAFSIFFVLGFLAVQTSAQTKVNVRFKKGMTTGTYNGSIRGERYTDYVFRAKAGQTLRVVLTQRSGAPALFNVLQSGSDVAIDDDARQTTSYRGELPEDGSYVVRVYMEKGDRQNRRSASFRIAFSIEVE